MDELAMCAGNMPNVSFGEFVRSIQENSQPVDVWTLIVSTLTLAASVGLPPGAQRRPISFHALSYFCRASALASAAAFERRRAFYGPATFGAICLREAAEWTGKPDTIASPSASTFHVSCALEVRGKVHPVKPCATLEAELVKV